MTGHVTKGVLIEREVPLYIHVSFRDLQELKEQFTTYRKEKGENDVMIGQQLETLRQEASALRMNNVKITAKVLYSICRD